MCGIMGYVGPREAYPVLVGGLERLEYRGYDSAGVSRIVDGKYEVYRASGKLSELKNLLGNKLEVDVSVHPGVKAQTHVGIGHTRWATHGRPNETNAHPHVAGSICLVHNGIIENYAEIKAQLKNSGRTFLSETDTEVVAHLIDEFINQEKISFLSAVRKAVSIIRGSYALLITTLSEPDRIIIAKNSSPIVIGLAADETFIASDIAALLPYTRNIVVVDDGEIACVTRGTATLEKDAKPVVREPLHVTWDAITAEKGGFKHFMLKEIHEQPNVVTDTFRGRINQDKQTIDLPDLDFDQLLNAKNLDHIYIAACGTAWHAGLVAKYYIEEFAKIPVEVEYASEFRYRSIPARKNSLFVAISQSGETIDTLGALSYAQSLRIPTFAICNVIGSSIARKADQVLYTHAGPEISVASTKAFLTQLTAAYLFAVKLASIRGTLSAGEITEKLNALVALPNLIDQAIKRDAEIEKIAERYNRFGNFLFLGRGFLYPVAMEGALKLKEISYVYAQGYPAGEMKHGPISLVDANTPTLVVLGHDGVNYEKAMSNLKEVESRGGKIVAITDRATDGLKEAASHVIELGAIPRDMLPMVLTVPLQLFAYYGAVSRGTDVDQPRNLAKSVTVE
ncbi:glutamine--fructose-6-phosphate transaminase (isomerizing) [bacterium]|nr:glutamine--fructose-6-phosphate transaminase (isomerizing) [bacterium]